MGKKIAIIYLFFIVFSSALIAQNSLQPREGEGIHAFLRRHKCTGADDYNSFISLNKGKFGKNKSLLKGVTYKLPPHSTSNKEVKEVKETPTSANTTIGVKKKYPLLVKNMKNIP